MKAIHWKIAAIFAVGVVASLYFQSRFGLGVDRQMTPCNEGRVFLVDKEQRVPVVGLFYEFHAPLTVSPVYAPGTKMLKQVLAGPGDHIEIRPDDTIWINGEQVASGLPHLDRFAPGAKSKFHGQRTLKDNEWWVMAQSPLSFDSRYWGTVPTENFIGRAYVIF